MKMTIQTVFEHGSWYGIGGPLGDHIIGARDEAGRPVYVAREGTTDKDCRVTGNYSPLADIGSRRRQLRSRIAELVAAPSIVVTLPGEFRESRMLFPHLLRVGQAS